jgi:hypothetical protein
MIPYGYSGFTFNVAYLIQPTCGSRHIRIIPQGEHTFWTFSFNVAYCLQSFLVLELQPQSPAAAKLKSDNANVILKAVIILKDSKDATRIKIEPNIAFCEKNIMQGSTKNSIKIAEFPYIFLYKWSIKK